MLGIGDLADRSVPVAECAATIRRALDYGLNLVGTVCFKTLGAGKLLGDTTGYSRPLEERHERRLPRLTEAECLHYTLTVDPDVALLGLSCPDEQDAAFRAFEAFTPLAPAAMREIERRAAEAVEGKGPRWWNP